MLLLRSNIIFNLGILTQKKKNIECVEVSHWLEVDFGTIYVLVKNLHLIASVNRLDALISTQKKKKEKKG